MKYPMKILCFLLCLCYNNIIGGQCEDMFISNEKTERIHNLETKELRISPMIQLKNTEKSGIIIIITTGYITSENDKLECGDILFNTRNKKIFFPLPLLFIFI